MVRSVVKRDLVELASRRSGESLVRCSRVLDALLQVSRDLLINPEEDVRIELRELCILETKTSGYKGKARNPRTGEPLAVPSHRITRFRLTKPVRDAQRMIGPRQEASMEQEGAATSPIDSLEKAAGPAGG